MRDVSVKALHAAAVAAALAAATAHAEPVPYTLDAGHTGVHWEVLHMGTSTLRGRFDRVAGSVAFDAKAQQIDIGITVDTTSLSTGQATFDGVLRGAQLLAATANPTAYYTARRATWEGDTPREIVGEITLRGQSQPMTLRALRWKCGLNVLFQREVCGGDFEATLKRSDFGMTLALPLVADEVRLLIQVEAIRGN